MSGPNATPVPEYDVGPILPEDDLSVPGRSIPSHRFYFTTRTGITGSVLIPNTQMNDVEIGRGAIEAQIRLLQTYMHLGKR